MTAMSDYLEDKLLDSVLNDAAFPSNATIHLRLYTVAPDDTGGGTEVTGGSYAAEALAGAFTKVSTGIWSNTSAIVFPTATADWGTIVAAALWDAPTGGNMLLHGSLNAPQTIDSGSTAQFPAGDLKFEAR